MIRALTDLMCDGLKFSRELKLTEIKTSCFLELLIYVVKQLVYKKMGEEDNFQMFKELLLRHSIQRPPHSLAIFNLQEVKAITDFMLDNFYSFYSFFSYALTKKDELQLATAKILSIEDPTISKLGTGKVIPFREIDDLKNFLSDIELEALEKENEYMLRGPGRIERIMREELEKLSSHMEDKIRRQDEEFINKMTAGGAKK
jgi:hypothetical protein